MNHNFDCCKVGGDEPCYCVDTGSSTMKVGDTLVSWSGKSVYSVTYVGWGGEVWGRAVGENEGYLGEVSDYEKTGNGTWKEVVK